MPAQIAVHLLLILSGFAGLGYQVVWVRMLTVGLGVETAALLGVVAAVFAGLALGGLAFHRAIARTDRPGRWYAGLEAIIGLWALALIALVPAADGALRAALGPEPGEARRWLVSFLGPLLLLAPATVAMGATLPAAERLLARLTGGGRGVGGLYAANALGAAIGAVATLALLAPAVGFSGSLAAFASANFLCALVGWRLDRAAPAVAATVERGLPPGGRPLATLFATGLLGIGLEVAVVRAFGQTMENTVYSFAVTLAVYLLGAAAGGALWQAGRARGAGPLTLACAGAAAWCALAASQAGWAYAALRTVYGSGPWAALAAEATVAAGAFLPASVVMGALFAELAQAARRADGGLGRAFAANTLGGAAAPAAIGLLVVPALGAVGAMAAIAVGYAALAPARPLLRALRAGAATAAAVALLASGAGRLVDTGPGERALSHREGPATAATVIEAADGSRRLVVDGRFVMGGDATEAVDRWQGHLPLLLHPAPRRALFLGLGAGATFAAARTHPGLEATAVELSPEVLDALRLFPGAALDVAAAAPALRLARDDARRVIRAPGAPYDVIVADLFHPARDGAGLLYTVEHFAAARDRLAPGGLFAQWLPLHQLDLPTLRLILRSFLAVFPEATAHLANASLETPLLLLVGGEGGRPALEALEARGGDAALRAALATLGVDGPFAIVGGFLAGPAALGRLAGEGPLNTDDRPLVAFRAPATVYAPLPPARERLLALLDATEAAPADAVALGPTRRAAVFGERLAAYWAARDAFVRLGAAVGLTGDPATDAQALAPALLDIARASPDYLPAQRPLLSIAESLAADDPDGAAVLLDALVAVAPRQARRVAVLRASMPMAATP